MDLSDVIRNGIIIPTKNQCKEGKFIFSFQIKNNTDSPMVYCYKIFYQNETYKLPEYFEVTKNKKIIKEYNPYSCDNFYGSWAAKADSFHKTITIPPDGEYYTITDTFNIVGNPRNEEKYFGSQTKYYKITKEDIENTKKAIKNSKSWLKAIKEKAKINKCNLEDQINKDAIWIINDNLEKGDFNNRWKRNPRVGCYSFMLIVGSENEFLKLSPSMKDISKSNYGEYFNPYYYFLYDSIIKNVNIIKSQVKLKTNAKFDMNSGIFVDLNSGENYNITRNSFDNSCGNTETLFYKAQFEQFFHNIDKNYKLDNIPLIYDVVDNNYSKENYYNNIKKFDKQRIKKFVNVTDCPCKTVKQNTNSKSLSIITPGYAKYYKKENVGIKTRIGYTYGKYRAKIKFPKIINNENVWNGITCAFWLLGQTNSEWNNRKICETLGYIPKSEVGKTDNRVKSTSYSEIDFEILKTSLYWPSTSYKGMKVPADKPSENNNIIITCTNWDLACHTPLKFGVGAVLDTFNGVPYILHRWDFWYKALTLKYQAEHNVIFGQPYYFEIGWYPDRIEWKIGKTPETMELIGYMDNTVTTIPDNQMIIVFSQEFHDSSWWPLSPFAQDNIPFPEKDIEGQIYEIEIN